MDFFISNFVDKTSFAAINLIMPILIILGTVGFMFGTGGTVLVSMSYGVGHKEKANSYFLLIAYVSFGIGILLTVFGIIFICPISILLGTEGNIRENCVI